MSSVAELVTPTTKDVQWASDMQGEAWNYGPYPMLLSGGWGAGKTWLGCNKAMYLSGRYRRNRGVIARYRSVDLRATTMSTFYKICPPRAYAMREGGRRNDQNGYMKFGEPYGSSDVLFLHLDDPETAGIIRGLEINWFLWDQAEENPEHGEELFDMLLGRLGRWDIAEVPEAEIAAHVAAYEEPWPYRHPETGTPVPPAYAMLTCNPDVETHWLYRRFHPESAEHREPQGSQPSFKAQGYKMFHMPSEDNRFLGETNKQFLLAHDEAFLRRNVLGLWGSPEGAIHVVHESSVIQGSPELADMLRQTCTLFRSMDYGDSAPTVCAWWAVDRNGNCFLWQEYYMPNQRISTHRANIAGISDPHDRFEIDLADPSIFHQMPAKKGGRFCVADEYAEVLEQPRHTALFWHAADNNELGTRNRINEYLWFDPDRMHPLTHERGSARLFFVMATERYQNGVKHALQQTRSQRRLKIGTNLGKPLFSDERDDTITDHAYDVVRYFIASRPPAPRIPPPSGVGTFSSIRNAALKMRRQGQRR